MADVATITLDIDERIAYIATQVSLGCSRGEVVAEQFSQLLNSFSMIRIDINAVTRISKHLLSSGVFTDKQLVTFSGSLRAAASRKRTKKGRGRSMQSNEAVEHSLTNKDWTQLQALGAKPNQTSDPLETIIAARLHRFGMVCPDVDTLKRASGIVQVCMINTTANAADKRSICRGVQAKLKKLDEAEPWPFEYIDKYPRSQFELPADVFTYAYGDDRPIEMPDDIDHTTFKLIVADTKYNTPRKVQPPPSHAPVLTLPIQNASPSPMQEMMQGGPFAHMAHAFMLHMQKMSTPNTCDPFRGRVPLQIKDGKNQESNELAFDAEPRALDELDELDDDPAELDNLEKLEADMQNARKASAKVTADMMAAAAAVKADAVAKAAADKDAKKTGKGKKKPVKEAPEAPTAKMKAGEGKGKGEAAAAKAKAKGKAKSKGKALPFDINVWIPAHITRAEATAEPKRNNFVSNAHKRVQVAARRGGVDDVQPLTKRAREAAGELHDKVHK